MLQIFKLSEAYDVVNISVQQDIDRYDIKPSSTDHLRLLYHYTLVYIFETRRIHLNTVFIVDQITTDLTPKAQEKYIKFTKNLQKTIPTAIINIEQTHHDPIFTNILMNMNQKSTVKKTNILKLKRFCEKYRLTELLEKYLHDPTYKFVISA